MPTDIPLDLSAGFVTTELEEMGLSEEAAQSTLRGVGRGIQKATVRQAAKVATKTAGKSATKKTAKTAAGKIGSRLIPFAGEIMMAVDAAPVATEAVRRTARKGKEAFGETASHLKGGRVFKSAGAGVRGAASTTWEATKGIARTGVAALTARELAEATYSQAERDALKEQRGERARKKAERMMREAEAMTRKNPPTSPTRVVNLVNERADVYIGRPGKWGNPFIIGTHGTRDEVIEKFRVYALEQGLDRAAHEELKGKVLGCYCAPNRCHGDLLAMWANEGPSAADQVQPTVQEPLTESSETPTDFQYKESTVNDPNRGEQMRRDYENLRNRVISLGDQCDLFAQGMNDSQKRKFVNDSVTDVLNDMNLDKTPENYVRGMRGMLRMVERRCAEMGVSAQAAQASAQAAPTTRRRSPEKYVTSHPTAGFSAWEGETFTSRMSDANYRVSRTTQRTQHGGPWIVGGNTFKGYASQQEAEKEANRLRQRDQANEAMEQRVITQLSADPYAPVRFGIDFPAALGKRRKAVFDQPLKQDIEKYYDDDKDLHGVVGYEEVDALRLMDRANMDAWKVQLTMFERMMERQTQAERLAGDALLRNKLGFSAADAKAASKLLTEIASYSKRNVMPPTRVRAAVARMLTRYDDQLLEIMNQGAAKAGYVLRTNPARRVKTVRRNPAAGDVRMYQMIMACLRAIQWKAWTLHWVAGGANYYGDHLLLQRLYDESGIDDAVDALGERMVAYFGPTAVDPRVINEEATKMLEGQGFQSLLGLEQKLQKMIRVAWKANQESGEGFSLGIDDYLMALANERDTAIYLLQRRLG